MRERAENLPRRHCATCAADRNETQSGDCDTNEHVPTQIRKHDAFRSGAGIWRRAIDDTLVRAGPARALHLPPLPMDATALEAGRRDASSIPSCRIAPFARKA